MIKNFLRLALCPPEPRCLLRSVDFDRTPERRKDGERSPKLSRRLTSLEFDEEAHAHAARGSRLGLAQALGFALLPDDLPYRCAIELNRIFPTGNILAQIPLNPLIVPDRENIATRAVSETAPLTRSPPDRQAGSSRSSHSWARVTCPY